MNTIQRHLPTASRLLLGVIFTVFGLNFFLQFLPAPPPPPQAQAFVGGLFASGYFFPLLKGTEIAAGLLLLGNRFVPLALTVLAPIVLNIAAYHLFLAPSGVALSITILALELYLAWHYRAAFAPLLRAKQVAERRPRLTSTQRSEAAAA